MTNENRCFGVADWEVGNFAIYIYIYIYTYTYKYIYIYIYIYAIGPAWGLMLGSYIYIYIYSIDLGFWVGGTGLGISGWGLLVWDFFTKRIGDFQLGSLVGWGLGVGDFGLGIWSCGSRGGDVELGILGWGFYIESALVEKDLSSCSRGELVLLWGRQYTPSAS